jgi:hypothetical protein
MLWFGDSKPQHVAEEVRKLAGISPYIGLVGKD